MADRKTSFKVFCHIQKYGNKQILAFAYTTEGWHSQTYVGWPIPCKNPTVQPHLTSGALRLSTDDPATPLFSILRQALYYYYYLKIQIDDYIEDIACYFPQILLHFGQT